MKKLLNLLSIFVLTTTAIVPKLIVDKALKTKIKDDENRKIELDVDLILSECKEYVAPANIQMIMQYFQVNLEKYSQEFIYEALGGLPEGGGIPVTANFAGFLDTAIPEENFERTYDQNIIHNNFGSTQNERALFQDYVFMSLSKGHPVMVYYYQLPKLQHAVLITGIITNDNPDNTQYIVTDPLDEEKWVFNGTNITEIFFNYDSGLLIGYQTNPEFRRKDIAIDDHKVDKIGLTDYENHEVVRIQIDLTVAMEITKPYNLQQLYSELRLDHFNGGIYTFNGGKSVKDFRVPITGISEDDLETQTPLVTIDSASETVGWAHIEGKISAQLEFRITPLSHIIAELVIYIQATSKWTYADSHVWFATGDVLSFV